VGAELSKPVVRQLGFCSAMIEQSSEDGEWGQLPAGFTYFSNYPPPFQFQLGVLLAKAVKS